MNKKRTAWSTTCILATATALAASAPAASAATSPTKAYTYTTRACPSTSGSTQAGLCYDPGVGTRAKVDAKRLPSGALAFFASSFSMPPMKQVQAEGYDENQNLWRGLAVDAEALQGLVLPSRTEASRSAATVFGSAPIGYTRSLSVSDSNLGKYSTQGALLSNTPFERSVTATFSLAGYGGTTIPVIGPGARQSITFGGGGPIRSLMSLTPPPVTRSSSAVSITSATTAKSQCSTFYGKDAAGRTQSTPQLVYYAPPAAGAVGPDDLGMLNGGASFKPNTLYPFWQCVTAGESDGQGTGALIPAVQSAAPSVTANVKLTSSVSQTNNQSSYSLSASALGGKAPYRYYWNLPGLDVGSDSSITGETIRQASLNVPVSAVIGPSESQSGRNTANTGRITVTVIDANGVSSSVAVTASAVNGQVVSATGRGPASGGALATAAGELACCPDWPCAANSSNGFKTTIASKGFSRSFWWMYNDAWEVDYKDLLMGGADNTGIDSVDIGWYTGHGSPNGITFTNTGRNDGTVGPADARWGNENLEWLQLESCNVLQNTSTSNAALRWHQSFQGLHVLNGFETTAACNNGLGGSFASLLFDYKVAGVTVIPRRSVVAAWAAAARANEPSGTIYRSIAPMRADGVTTLGDFVWGQGTVGPDIPNNEITAYWVATGTV